MKFTYAPYNLCMHLDPFSGPKNDAFWTSKSVKIDPKTRSETKMFFESLLVRFLVSFGTPWGAVWVPKWDAKPCTSRLGLPGTHPGVDLASSKRHYGISKALGVALGPFLAPILGPWPPFWTLRGSILDPPGPHPGTFGSNYGLRSAPNSQPCALNSSETFSNCKTGIEKKCKIHNPNHDKEMHLETNYRQTCTGRQLTIQELVFKKA